MTTDNQQTQITRHLMANRNALYGFILAHVRKIDLAEDIFQEVCIVICEKWERYDQSRPFRSWAMGIAHNEIRHHMRRISSRRMVTLDPAVSEALIADPTWDEDPAPERDALRQCLKHLGDRARKMLHLRYSSNLNAQEIGKAVGWKAQSVAVAMTRIRKSLHECITRTLRMAEVG